MDIGIETTKKAFFVDCKGERFLVDVVGKYSFPYLNIMYPMALKSKARLIVELGTGRGLGVEMFSDVCKLTGGTVFTIDIEDTQKEWQVLLKNIDLYNRWERLKSKGNIVFIRGDSVEVGLNWTKGNIDVLFCDSDHSYEHLVNELKIWSTYKPKLIFVHDTLTQQGKLTETNQASVDFASQEGKEYFNFFIPHGLGVIVK